MRDPNLSSAYALNGSDDIRRLYARWADSYEANFAASMDYRLPAEVAAAFLRADPAHGPVLDVGAGTGLLAAALRGLGYAGAIDALDLSAQMLAQAAQKGLYRTLIEADILKPLPMRERYAGIVSSGTFTHGHVGPEGIAPLLGCAVPGAVMVLSINRAVWDRLGFAAHFKTLESRMDDLTLDEVAIYGAGAQATNPDHADDRALIVSFRTR